MNLFLRGGSSWIKWGMACLFLSSMMGILGVTGYYVGGIFTSIASVSGSVLITLFYPKAFHPFILKLYFAKPLPYVQAPVLYRALSMLSERAKLKVSPVLYIYPGQVMNAYIYGTQKNKMIAISEKMFNCMNLNEICGVLAHEISHIKNRDMLLMAFSDVLVRLTRFLAVTGQLIIFFNLPLIFIGRCEFNLLSLFILILATRVSMLLQRFLSRSREYNADRCAVRLLKNPNPLIQALKKTLLHQKDALLSHKPEPIVEKRMAFFQTHPLIEKRIFRLEAKGKGVGGISESIDSFLSYRYFLKSSDTP